MFFVKNRNLGSLKRENQFSRHANFLSDAYMHRWFSIFVEQFCCLIQANNLYIILGPKNTNLHIVNRHSILLHNSRKSNRIYLVIKTNILNYKPFEYYLHS